jgi:hypothetical protein
MTKIDDKNYKDVFNRFNGDDKQNVYTPPTIVRDMCEKIPINIDNKILVWYNMEFVLYLVKEVGFSPENIYIYTNTKDKLVLEKQGFNILYQTEIDLDKLEIKNNMKFDVVLGNSPFQQKVGPKKTEPLWNKFVKKSFDICNEGGYVSLIHPNGWRNIDGDFKNIQQLLKSKNICYLSLNSVEEGQKIFGVTTPFDWYVIKNIENNQDTIIKFQDDTIQVVNVKNLEIIPNNLFNEVMDLIAKDDEEKVDIIFSFSNYETRKKYMSKTQSDEFQYPCVYSVLKDGTINYMYSSTNQNGHFGIPKIVLGNGANPTSTIDVNGDYGLTQFAFGIVDDINNLSTIQNVIKNEKFQKINKATKYVATAGNPLVYPKIISLFRKDFWKDFIDD